MRRYQDEEAERGASLTDKSVDLLGDVGVALPNEPARVLVTRSDVFGHQTQATNVPRRVGRGDGAGTSGRRGDMPHDGRFSDTSGGDRLGCGRDTVIVLRAEGTRGGQGRGEGGWRATRGPGGHVQRGPLRRQGRHIRGSLSANSSRTFVGKDAYSEHVRTTDRAPGAGGEEWTRECRGRSQVSLSCAFRLVSGGVRVGWFDSPRGRCARGWGRGTFESSPCRAQ